VSGQQFLYDDTPAILSVSFIAASYGLLCRLIGWRWEHIFLLEKYSLWIGTIN